MVKSTSNKKVPLKKTIKSRNNKKISVKNSPKKSPKKSVKKSPKNSPKNSVKKSPKNSPKKSPKNSPKKSPKNSPKSRNNIIYLSKSTRSDKKFMVVVDNKTIHFGAKGMSDYTIHKDSDRKNRYQNRHKSRENWGKSGIKTAGFWANNLLWNKPTLAASIKDIEKKYNVIIKRN